MQRRVALVDPDKGRTDEPRVITLGGASLGRAVSTCSVASREVDTTSQDSKHLLHHNLVVVPMPFQARTMFSTNFVKLSRVVQTSNRQPAKLRFARVNAHVRARVPHFGSRSQVIVLSNSGQMNATRRIDGVSSVSVDTHHAKSP